MSMKLPIYKILRKIYLLCYKLPTSSSSKWLYFWGDVHRFLKNEEPSILPKYLFYNFLFFPPFHPFPSLFIFSLLARAPHSLLFPFSLPSQSSPISLNVAVVSLSSLSFSLWSVLYPFLLVGSLPPFPSFLDRSLSLCGFSLSLSCRYLSSKSGNSLSLVVYCRVSFITNLGFAHKYICKNWKWDCENGWWDCDCVVKNSVCDCSIFLLLHCSIFLCWVPCLLDCGWLFYLLWFNFCMMITFLLV